MPTANSGSRKHFVDTIKNRVPTKVIRKHVKDKSITSLLTLKSYPCWGVTNGGKDRNKNQWLQMNSGDIGLFYKNNKFFCSGVVVFKFKNETFSKFLWKEKFNKKLNIFETWENMFLLDDIKDLDIHIEDFNDLMGYEKNNKIFAYRVLDEVISEIVLEEFALKASKKYFKKTKAISKKEKRKKTIEALSKNRKTDSKGYITTTRLEQSILRKHILGPKVTKCSLCHKELPNKIIVAGHIWERRKIKDEKIRNDPDIVMPVCKLGCDDLFENGFITVNSNGFVEVNSKKYFSKALKKYVKQYKNKQCLYFNKRTKGYFEKRYV